MRQIGERFEKNEKRISGLEQAVQQMAQEQQARLAKQMQEAHTKVLIDVTSAGYERGTAYTNVLMLAGYAGIFGIWSFTKDHLTETASLTVALLVGLSLMFFVGWELAKMIHGSFHVSKMTKLISGNKSPGDFFTELEKTQTEAKVAQLWFGRAWFVILAVTIIPGFGGALLLYYHYLAILLDWPAWP
ncbi:MAG: hypothetical protein KL840_14220 [Aquamicrobium sp.]|nr:hypothetical protein [Aquamicrobium sp.]